MDGWKSWKSRENSFLTSWYQRVRESYVAVWFFGMFQTGGMSTTSNSGGGGGGGGGGGVGGALSLMGCVREASPPPQNHHSHHHHYHHHHHQQQQQQQQQYRGLGEYPSQNSVDPLPKEPKKRRFHPLRGLRKIFRRKSRGAADVRLGSTPGTGGASGERDAAEFARIPREEVTLRHPAGRPEEARSRSASELLTDSCDRESKRSSIVSIASIGSIRFTSQKYNLDPSVKPRRSIKHVFLRRNGTEDSFVKLRGGAGKLSVSHDSVFPGEVPHTRPLSSLDSLATLERRQERKSNEIEHKDYAPYVAQRHRISLRVLEQIKTVIENRNQLASATSSDIPTSNVSHTAGERYQQETTENRFGNKNRADRSSPDESHVKVTKPAKENVERSHPAKEDLPQFESSSLNHTAALHRISVRPKNRRPPRRSMPPTSNASTSTITTIVEDSSDDLNQRKSNNVVPSSPIELKAVPSVVRKSSSRISRSSDILEGVETPPTQQQQQPRLPRKPSSAISLSPDSLDATSTSRTSVDTSDEQVEIRSVARRPSNRISKGSDIFEELEAKLPRRRASSSRISKSPDSLEASSPGWFSKSTEGFDKLVEYEESKPVIKRLLNPISKSSDRVSKSSDSLEAIEALTSDDSIERRRSSFEFRARRPSKLISKSSESFDMLDQSPSTTEMIVQELQKRSSISDMNLSRGRRLSKSASKSSESFERIEISETKPAEVGEKREDEKEEDEDEEEVEEPEEDVEAAAEEEREQEIEEEEEKTSRRSGKRMSSESSDNLDAEDRLENRRVRRAPKRVSGTSIVDIVPIDDNEEEKRITSVRKSRLQKSSESSELGSTDTLDSERRNKSSESTETLDSLEKDVEQDRKEEEMTDNVVDRRDKNDSWSSRSMTTTDSDQTSMADGTEDSNSLISPDKFYWRQSSDSKENIDIHQLLAITIVTRMADNGNNQRSPVIYPKKKQQITSSPPTSPVAKQEDNKMIFDNLLTSKNDEDLQNMLNGNISEVSTDTKSFKEKLIMFEKLGK